jgi:dTDP-4-dehydrorhamnose reductase
VSRILVTGAAGVVGGYVAEAFADHDLVLTDAVADGYVAVDVSDADAVAAAIGDTRPDVVIHLAAATDVDRCELEPKHAWEINAAGTRNVALACRDARAVLVYTSTAGVFSGDKAEPYTELDEPGPANVYGHTKLAGEREVQDLLERYVIARAGWMIGGGPKEKKFVGMMRRFLDEGRTELQAVNDKFGSPTYARDFAAGIRRLLELGDYGLYHLVNTGPPCTRYDVTVALCEILGRDDVVVEPVGSERFPLPAPRARSEAMANHKLEQRGLDLMRPWRDALAAYLREES